MVGSSSGTSILNTCASQDLIASAVFQGESGYQVGNFTIENVDLKIFPTSSQTSSHFPLAGCYSSPKATFDEDLESRAFGHLALNLLPHHGRAAVGLSWQNWCRALLSIGSLFNGTWVISLSRESTPLRVRIKSTSPSRCDRPGATSTLAVGRFRRPQIF